MISKGVEVANAFYSLQKVAEMFGGSHLKNTLTELLNSQEIPPLEKSRSGAIFKKGWFDKDLHNIGKRIGFLDHFEGPVSMSVFTTKGGVLKTFTALNIARVAALHGIKTCVVGLDIQGDITSALGFEPSQDEGKELSDLIQMIDETKGLADFFNGQARLGEIIHPTDLENLFLIPETPELVAFNESLTNINRREYWLNEKVIKPLKQEFDLVVMDCSPNWNKLTTNALVASDILVSPLECKINNFRNFKVFGQFLDEFKREMHLEFQSVFVPTRYSSNRKLSLEILEWYKTNVSGCLPFGIKESVHGEEATALHKSVLEHIPGKPFAMEMKEVLEEIWKRAKNCSLENPHEQTFKYPGDLRTDDILNQLNN